MDAYEIPTEVLLQGAILYGCLPLWVIMGFCDYLCHRKARIEQTTGLRESLYHVVMGGQIGVPVFLGLLFEINVLLLLLALIMMVFHVWVAHNDVTYAIDMRRITIWETHTHSFLEVLPFVVLLLLVCKRWSAFVDLITFNWAGQLTLVPKATPIGSEYILGYAGFMLVVGVAPYLEEVWRCWKAGPIQVRAQ